MFDSIHVESHMCTNRASRILVIEDDQQVAIFISKALSKAGFRVDIANEGPGGLELGAAGGYDLIVLDVMLPEMDGLSLLKNLRDRKIDTPVLFLSGKSSVDDRVRGLQAGGDDYLVKPFHLSELLARVQSLLRRSRAGGEPHKLQAGNLVMDLLSRRVFRAEEEISLAPQEFSLLEYLMRNQGVVLTRVQILQNVWGYNFNPSTNLVEVHICRLREKIEHSGKPQILKTIRGAGYILAEGGEAR
ncbi:MAG: response regulator transcription factor [Syntrophobacteraceae bacterium]